MKFKSIFTYTLTVGLSAAVLYGCGNKSEENKPTTPQQQVAKVMVDAQLKARLDDFAHKPRPRGAFGFDVYDLTADKPVYGFQTHQVQPSASCLKLLSGVAGLHLLGTKYLYATSLYTKGAVNDGTFKGDISFKAGFDPQLDPTGLVMFAQALRRKGIRKLEGRFVVDLAFTDAVQSEAHWYPWDLSFSQYGILYKGAEKVTKALRQALQTAGISIDEKQFIIGQTPRGSHCIFRFYRSIDRVIRRMWKNSSNTQATALLYTIGHKANPHEAPVKAGMAYLRRFMRQELKLRDSSLVIHDGCGLCTHNQIAPQTLTTILRYGYKDKAIYRFLHNNLSVSGVDGTLRREMASPILRGKVRAKTGTLSHPYGISSLAGYCQGANGHLLAFAIMDHDMSVLDARVLQKKLCEILVTDGNQKENKR